MIEISYHILTLKDTLERYQKCLNLLNKNEIFTRPFFGLNNNKVKVRGKNSIHTNGLIGCWISHLMMWQNSKPIGSKWAVFFEDDFECYSDTKENIELILKSVPDEYDVCFLLSHNLDNSGTKIIKEINELLVEKENVWSTACIAIKNKSINKIIENFNHLPYNHIDLEFVNKHLKGDIKICFARKNVGGLISGVSSSISGKRIIED